MKPIAASIRIGSTVEGILAAIGAFRSPAGGDRPRSQIRKVLSRPKAIQGRLPAIVVTDKIHAEPNHGPQIPPAQAQGDGNIRRSAPIPGNAWIMFPFELSEAQGIAHYLKFIACAPLGLILEFP